MGSLKKALFTGVTLFTLFAPVTAFADGWGGGSQGQSVTIDKQNHSQTIITANGTQTYNWQTGTVGLGSNPTGTPSGPNGSSANPQGWKVPPPSGKTPGSKTPDTNWSCDMQCQESDLANTLINVSETQVLNQQDPSGVWNTHTKVDVTDGSSWMGLGVTAQYQKAYGPGEIVSRGYTPLNWDWKLVNTSTGTSMEYDHTTMHELYKQLGTPGDYSVYYREYGSWETGYYTYETVTYNVTVGNYHTTQTRQYSFWHHVAWEHGYYYGPSWVHLLDFTLDQSETSQTFCIPGCVEQQTIQTTTVQTVAGGN